MSLTVVVPCYNEASRGVGVKSFENRLAKILEQLIYVDYKLILVDDGSTDDSIQVFQDFVDRSKLNSTWCCLRQEKNMGKGAAIRRGLMSTDTDYVLMMDADLSVEPYEVVSLLSGIRKGECYVASRYMDTSKIVNERPFIRRFISFWCRFLVDQAFHFGVSDTQCGFKLFPAAACHQLTDYTVNSWLYDVELLYNVKCAGIEIREFPVKWNNMENESTLNAANAVVPSLKALWLLFRHKRTIKRLYKSYE